MQGINDGMGGEEINQTGPTTSQINVTGSIASASQISGANIYSTGDLQGEDVIGDTSISGANVYSAGTVTGSEINNADGLVKSVSMGSPAVYNGQVQGGTIAMSAGSEADVEFGVPFSSKKWAITFGTSGATPSVTLPTLSGAMTSSGATVIGVASAVYYYTAVGY